MRKTTIVRVILLAGLTSLIIFGCARQSTKGADLSPDATRQSIGNVPDWYNNPPVREGYKYNQATATSQDMQMAVDKAVLNAASNLAGELESEMSGLVNRAREETGQGTGSYVIDKFSSTQEQVISLNLKNYRVEKQDIQREPSDTGTLYRAYVRIEWDEGAAQKQLINQIKSDQALYTAMRSTELFEEMEQKVEAYRNRHNKD
ncbi:MAG: hypothetical protein HQ510_03185 [Candidatus Marinimicrobia bacterium]|nr:hypothetical protein [Candidatus Neomarinimicrobiota bacterium]